MKIGDTEVLSITEAAKRLQVAPVTLRLQIQNGALAAQKIGKQWVVTVDDLTAYDECRKQARGFARPDHPLHGKRGGGGRRKSRDSEAE